MDYQTLIKSKITLNHNKRIGRVIYIVEGNKTEMFLLKRIFSEILGYDFFSENRDGLEMKFTKKSDSNSIIYVINSKNSNISSIHDDDEVRTLVNDFIRNNVEYDFAIENAAIFYLFDRDYKSNHDYIVEDLIKYCGNSREATSLDYDMHGLLLLSYPAIESYLCENFVKNYHKKDFGLGYRLKKYLKNRDICLEDITEKSIIKAIYRSHTMLNEMDIPEYNIDDFSDTNLHIYDYQENFIKDNRGYKLLSMLSMSLIDIGIVNFIEAGE